MSSTMRSATSSFLPPLPFFLWRKDDKRPAKRAKPGVDQPAPKARVEPTLRSHESDIKCDIDVEKMLEAARKAPELSLLEWDGDAEAPSTLLPEIDELPLEAPSEPLALDTRARKIRDRYMSARFPGVVRSAADLQSEEAVIKSARLFFEDGQVDLALELLDLAIEENIRCEAARLAQLEILFLARDAREYVARASAFRAAHPTSEAWAEIKRLGQALAPGEALFGASSGPRDHEHYGPWPHLPNWIQASWDLTPEIVAADFHRAVMRVAKPNLQSAA